MVLKRLLPALFALLAVSASAQNYPNPFTQTATLTTASSGNCPGTGCVTMTVAAYGVVGVQLTGTWSGTVSFYGSIDQINFVALTCSTSGGSTVTSATGNGVWACSVGGFTQVQIGFSSYSSGSAVVTLQAAPPGGSAAGGGGSSGNVNLTQVGGSSISLGTSTAANSLPVALPTATITTLTPLSTVTANQGSANASPWLVTGTGGTFPVTGTFWQATQPVSGTFWQATQPVSGTFWQATQPVSAASGAIASGAVASGAYASGAVASGAYASGSISDGAEVTLGAKADAKSSATDTTSITAMQVLKEISYIEQNPVSRAVTNAGTFATQSAITAASGSIASGAIASGAIASGAIASGAIASGAVAAGAYAVGSIPPAAGALKSGVTAAMTGTTSTVVIAAVTSNYLYVTSCSFSNTHASVSTMMTLQDGSGGTSLWSVNVPFGGGNNVTFPVPLKVPTSGNGLYVANVTTGSNTFAACSGFSSTVSY